MTVVRLVRKALAVRATPADALRAVASEPLPFALTGAWAGGGALVGSSPTRVASPDEDPFALLDEVPEVVGADHPGPSIVGGGWFGWLGYGLGARVEALPPPPPRPAPLPPFQLAYYDHVLHLDTAGQWWFEALVAPEREAAITERLDVLQTRLERAAAAPARPAFTPPGPFRLTGAGAVGHVAAVADCRERIAAGEIFQANVCTRLETAWSGDIGELFANARAHLQPAYGATFPTPWGGIASCSPELFLRRAGRGRHVETAPIKGTIARAEDRADAEAARAALAGSAKDHAENVMIVDLMRNDLGRVCAYGSIAASPAEVEPHPGVWHLVARVTGELREDAGDAALVRAAFPPGSVTGAPKVQAMHVIAALEGTAREAYTGAIGFSSPVAGLEMNVAIRTFEARDGRLWLGVGGGIVADSDPERELEECFVKARPLVAALGSSIEEGERGERTGAAGYAESPVRSVSARPAAAAADTRGRSPIDSSTVGAHFVPAALSRERFRPDLTQGVFETLLIRDGVAIRADEHLSRLTASVAACFEAELPGDLADRIAHTTAGLADGFLRIVARPASRAAVELTLETGPPRRRALPVPLAPFTLPGGLGAHKWRDRRLLDALAAAAGGATPLLVDGDGAVLEAGWGNVFIVEGDRLLTPPADGRLLPGVTREAILRSSASQAGLAPTTETLTLQCLRDADAILISSALAIAVPATLGASPAKADANSRADAVAKRLASALAAPRLSARAPSA